MKYDLNQLENIINNKKSIELYVPAYILNIDDIMRYEKKRLINGNLLNLREGKLLELQGSKPTVNSLILRASIKGAKVYVTMLDVSKVLIEIEFEKEIQ